MTRLQYKQFMLLQVASVQPFENKRDLNIGAKTRLREQCYLPTDIECYIHTDKKDSHDI
jgi:hypothetical protein